MSKRKVGQSRIWRFLFVLLIPICSCMLIPAVFAAYINASGPWIAKTILPVPPQSVHIAGISEADLIYDIQTDLYIMPASLDDSRVWFEKYVGLYNQNDVYLINWGPYHFSNEYLVFLMVGNITRRVPNITAKYDLMPECFSLKLGATEAMSIHLTEFHLTDEARDSLRDRIIAVVSTCYANW